MRTAYLILLLGLLTPAATALAADPPNIVFILADDYGPESVGCYGSKLNDASTPELDAMAANGMKFTRAYCTALCTPSRHQYIC